MNNFSCTDRIEAKCMQMCPEIECIKREKERLIHILETDSPIPTKNKVPVKSKMIKSYCRSAAGQELTKPELLRPPSILLQTTEYIFTNIIEDRRVSKTMLYNFIDDRLRSVKQDGVIQRLPSETWFQILTPLIHFYVYSAYIFCEDALPHFDQKLNKDQLIDCLYRFIKTYEDYKSETFSSTYAEMEAFYLIINFNKVDAINRAALLDLPDDVFQKTMKLVLYCYNNNFYAVFRVLNELPVLPACLFVALNLNKIRKHALQVMSSAYHSKNMIYPVSKLKSILAFDSENQVINECKFYEIEVISDKDVKFVNKLLKTEEACPRKMNFLDEKLKQISLTTLICSK